MPGPEPKRSLAGIAVYRPGKDAAPGVANPIKLSVNENPLGCSPKARAAYLDAAGSLHRYPDPLAWRLREALAARFDLDPSRLIFGAGSDELFALACQAFLEPGLKAVQPEYGFAAWAIAARAAGGEIVSARERDFHVDVDALLSAVDERTRIVFIANPANPTGTAIPFAEIERLHRALPETVLLVLDGAYAEFAEARADFNAGLGLAAIAPNILVTRTFSKIYGLAGLRIGWGYASTGVADAMNSVRLPFNVSGPAQAAAVAALADDAFIAQSVAVADEGRPRLEAMLARAGLRPLPSAANFVTALAPDDFPYDGAAIERRLAGEGVLVRNLSGYGLPRAVRITIGVTDELDALDKALERALG